VDDVFAFIIKMPLLHKVMTLRDDVVFLGFLYQAYIYRVDKSRPNEYGIVYELPEEDNKRQDSSVVDAGVIKTDSSTVALASGAHPGRETKSPGKRTSTTGPRSRRRTNWPAATSTSTDDKQAVADAVASNVDFKAKTK
jgi:hypothetical protein